MPQASRSARNWRRSPSTRRAWIEIALAGVLSVLTSVVALHPEGVDRNSRKCQRRRKQMKVALHPEGVDRNMAIRGTESRRRCRPPPGGRG